MTVIKFEDIPWASRKLRGGSFGDRNNTYVNFYGRGPWVIHCPTGNKPEKMIRLSAAAHGSFGTKVLTPVFSTDTNGEAESLNFNNLFLSSDGVDQWPFRGFGEETIRDSSCSMAPRTDYYFYIPEIVGGHPSRRHGVTLRYASSHSDNVEEFAVEELDLGEPMIHPMTGEDGMWYPNI